MADTVHESFTAWVEYEVMPLFALVLTALTGAQKRINSK